MSGPHSKAGRLEVQYNNEWGTVCSHGFDDNDAKVVCYQLFGTREGKAYPRALYGQGTGSIMLENVACTGAESRLSECPHREWKINDCWGHSEDVGVDCS